MSQLVFELSGEHDTLPKSEVIACIEAGGWQYTVTGSYDQVLIVETAADPGVLARRLALTHHILELVFIAPAVPEEVLKAAETADLQLQYGQSFVVRVSRVKNYGGISASFEKKLGAAIWHRGYPVSLESPDVTFRAIVTEGDSLPGSDTSHGSVCIFGRRLAEVDRSAFEERAPLKKPFFLPGVLMPRISRTVVNLTRINDGWLLDPFSGTGGTLVEAGLISRDIRVVGCDIQKKMVYGTRKNLRHYGTNYDVVWEDSLRMGIKNDSVDAVVTDFPYGQSTPIAGGSGGDFYRGALREMYRVLKPGHRGVIVSKEPMEKLLTDAGFTVLETHRQRIHKSLTRNFAVIKKP